MKKRKLLDSLRSLEEEDKRDSTRLRTDSGQAHNGLARTPRLGSGQGILFERPTPSEVEEEGVENRPMIDLNGVNCPVCGGAFREVCRFANVRTVIVCRGCGLRRLWPLPTDEQLRRFYGRPEYYTSDLAELHDDLIFGYDPESPIVRLYRRHLQAIVAAAPPPARLLELGCARGVFLDLARQAGYRTAGVDINPYAAHYARERFGLEAVATDLRDFAATEPFDIVAAFDVIEHVADPADFLKRAAGLLRPGGLAVIGTPDSSSFLYVLAEKMARWTGGLLIYPLYRLFGRGVEHLSVFDRKNLGRLAAKAGLEPVRSYGYAIPLANMTDVRGIYRPGLWLLGRRPYEFVLIARKK